MDTRSVTATTACMASIATEPRYPGIRPFDQGHGRGHLPRSRLGAGNTGPGTPSGGRNRVSDMEGTRDIREKRGMASLRVTFAD